MQKGFEINGFGDFVNISDTDFNYTSNFSYGAWFKADSIGSTKGVLSRISMSGWAGYGLYIGNAATTNTSCFGAGGFVNTVSDVAPVVDTWYHAMCVYNDSGMFLYVDGVLQDDTDSGAIGVSVSDDFYIGTWLNDNPALFAEFDGTIDEVMIFNRTLTQAEVSAIYDAGSNHYLNMFTVSDGSYNFTGYGVDAAGNLNQTETRDLSIGATKNITSCGTLDDENITYVLQNNVTGGSPCFTIGADNITLDLNGYTSFSTSGMADAINIANYDYFKLINGYVNCSWGGIGSAGNNLNITNVTVGFVFQRLGGIQLIIAS